MANKKDEQLYLLKDNSTASKGKAYIIYSDGTYSKLDDVSVEDYKKYFNEETSDLTKAKIFDGSREDVQEALKVSLKDKSETAFLDKDSVLYKYAKKDDKEKVGVAIAAPNKEENPIDPSIEEKKSDKWKKAAIIGGVGGAVLLGAYILNKDKEDEKTSLKGKDWDYYLNNAKETDQKKVMTKIDNILGRINASQTWMKVNDADQNVAVWGLTPEQTLSLYTYFNNLDTEELAQIYNGETVNVDEIMEQANQAMIAMSFFYANDTIGDTTIAELFNDEASKQVINDFVEIQARYNRATNDKERTEIAKLKKQMYFDYFIDNSTSKYVDVSSVPGASFIINTMFPVDFVRYMGSSADLNEYDEILVTGRIREDGTIEHQSKVDSACGNLKADLEKYNEDIKDIKAEHNARILNKIANFLTETEYEALTKDTYNYQEILELMDNKLKVANKYPVYVNFFNSTIDGERTLIPLKGNSRSYSASNSNSSKKTTSTGKAATKQEFSAPDPKLAAQQAIAAGAPKEMVDAATAKIEAENEKAREEAERKADELHDFYQGIYDDVFNGDLDKSEARDELNEKYKNGEISKDEYDKAKDVINKADDDREDYEKAEEKDGEIIGGEFTDKGSEFNKDGSIDIDINNDGKEENIPAHNPNDPNNPYNKPDYADGAFDVDKNNDDDEIVFDDPIAYNEEHNNNNTSNSNQGNQSTDNNTESKIEQNPISDEEMEDITFSDGAVHGGTSGGDRIDFTEDQLVDQITNSDNEEIEIDGEGLLEVISFEDFANNYEASQEKVKIR